MRKAEPPPLSQADTVADSFRLIVAEGLDHLEAHREPACAGDAEAIHQFRVALRRLRASLKLFRRMLDPVARDGFNDALRALGRILGAARDWDVFLLETIPSIIELVPSEADALNALVMPAERERETAHLALRTALSAPATEVVLQDLRDWSAAPDAFTRRKTAHSPVADVAARMLDRLAGAARRKRRRLRKQTDEERHALRKALKSLRYGVEMLQSLYRRDRLKPYRKRLSRLQEDLGQLNDAIAAVELVNRLPLLPGRAVVVQWSESRRQGALEMLPAAWRRFRATRPFW